MSDESQTSTVASHRSSIRPDAENGLPQPSKEMPHSDDIQVFDSPLDGGWEAWRTVFGTWLIQFCTYGYISAFGVYQDYYTRDFLKNKSPSDISWIGSFQMFVQYAPGVLVGRAFDAGHFHTMVGVGSIIQVFSMLMLSLAKRHQYYQVFLAQAVGMGLGQGLLFLPSITIIGHHFKRRRALATGVAVSGASVGGIVWPIMLNQLGKSIGFPNGIRASAALAGAALIAANLLMKTRPNATNTQQQVQKPNFVHIFSDAPYLVSISAAFCISLGLFFPYFYLQLYAVSKGIDDGLAFYVLAILNAGSVLGRLLPNFFADKIGPYNMLIPCLVISSILGFSIFGLHNFADISIFGALYGFWSGSYVSLIPSLLAQLSSHPGEHGTRMGIAFSIVGVALLIGTPIEGALLDQTAHPGTYVWFRPIIFCGVMVMCGAIGMTVSRYLYLKERRNSSRSWWRV